MGWCSRSPLPGDCILNFAVMDVRSECPRTPAEPRCHPGGGTLLLPCYFKQQVYNDGREKKQRGRSSVGMARAGTVAGTPLEGPGFWFVKCGNLTSLYSALSCSSWHLSGLVWLNLFLFYFAFWPRNWIKMLLKEYRMGISNLWFIVTRKGTGF